MATSRENLGEELMHGKHLAEQLRSTYHDPSSSTEDTLLILDNILSTYGAALSHLDYNPKQDIVKITYPIDESPPNDGHTWRKYGKKTILGSHFPREYYRCKHKARGYLALKQVQRSDKDPTVMEVTYKGNHCCNVTADQRVEEANIFEEVSSNFFMPNMATTMQYNADLHMDSDNFSRGHSLRNDHDVDTGRNLAH